MTFDTATARRLVLKVLASKGLSTNIALDAVETEVGALFGRELGRKTPGPSGDWRACLGQNGSVMVHEVIWDCIVERILTPTQRNNAILTLTAFGAEVAKEQRWSPYDPDGYLRELSVGAPKLAALCRMYVAEALNCFRGGSYLATAVMLGAASEGNMLDLFGRFGRAMSNAGMPEHAGYQEKLQRAHAFYDKYKVFRRYFDPTKSKLPDRLVDDVDGQMDGVLNLIRNYRNDAGHPTGTKIERMPAFRSLVLFMHYSQRVEEVADWMESHPSELKP